MFHVLISYTGVVAAVRTAYIACSTELTHRPLLLCLLEVISLLSQDDTVSAELSSEEFIAALVTHLSIPDNTVCISAEVRY